MELQDLVDAIARGIKLADETRPVWVGRKNTYQPGIGPHTERKTLELAFEHLRLNGTSLPVEQEIPYPDAPRSKCDFVIGAPPSWAVEAKMLRRMGDNGKPNDNILMHILSPYAKDRSALTDCDKLLASGFNCRLAIVIFGYDYQDYPMDPAIDAFEILARESVILDQRVSAEFNNLVHPVHVLGRVFGWEILEPSNT